MLYIDFPEGRMKFFGTLVFPNNRYLVLRFGQKDIICEDVLENMVSCSWQSCTCPAHSQLWLTSGAVRLHRWSLLRRGGSGPRRATPTKSG